MIIRDIEKIVGNSKFQVSCVLCLVSGFVLVGGIVFVIL